MRSRNAHFKQTPRRFCCMWSMGHIVRNTYFNNLFKVKEFRGRFQIERTLVSNHVHPFSTCHIKLWISSENRKTTVGLKLISFWPTLDLCTVVPWYPREIGLRDPPQPPGLYQCPWMLQSLTVGPQYLRVLHVIIQAPRIKTAQSAVG